MSLCVHIAGIIALAMVGFAPEPTITRAPAHRFIWVAPMAPRMPKPKRILENRALTSVPVPASVRLRTARVFREPIPRATLRAPVAAVDVPSAAVVFPPNAPPDAAAHLAILPAPPLKTDNLAPVVRSAAATVTGRMEIAGFGVPAATAASPATAAPMIGGFAATRIQKAPSADRISLEPGFGDATASLGPPATGGGQNVAARDLTPVEIIEKPRPLYTDEARRLRLEGEVLLETLFPATGSPRVLRVLHGLGHGLDENAMVAVQLIRFRPATHAGQSVDSNAIVHIVFQIAY